MEYINSLHIKDIDPRYFTLNIPWRLFESGTINVDSPMPLLFYLKVSSYYVFEEQQVKPGPEGGIFFDVFRKQIVSKLDTDMLDGMPAGIKQFRFVPMSTIFCTSGSIVEKLRKFMDFLFKRLNYSTESPTDICIPEVSSVLWHEKNPDGFLTYDLQLILGDDYKYDAEHFFAGAQLWRI